MELSAIGVSNDEALEIRSINGKPCGKAPRIELMEGSRVNLEVEFEAPYTGPISMVLTTIEEKPNAD